MSISQENHIENTSDSQRRWDVWRQDDNGNRFLVESHLPRADAQALADELESHGHKQLYWIVPSDRSN